MNLREFWQSFGQGKVYYPHLAQKIGGVSAAILYQVLAQWLKNNSTVQCSLLEITNATGLSETEQKLAREALQERSLLEFKQIQGQPPVYSFKLNFAQLEHLLRGETPPETKQPQSDPYFPPRRQAIAVRVTPHYQFSGPWRSQEELEAFQEVLLSYAKQQGYSNPGGWVFKIIDSISKGIKSPFWDEFIAGIPLGESQKIQQEWEVEPGVPYPAFESERIQYYIHKGEPLESAVAKARSELRNLVKAKDLWDGFLKKCDRIADDALKAKKLGVQTPYLPPSFSEETTVSKETVMEKLSQLHDHSSLLEEETSSEIPDLKDLQNLYHSPMTKNWVEEQIAKHPEWGYQIIDGQVVDEYPF